MKILLTFISVLILATGCASSQKTIVDLSNISGTDEAVTIYIQRGSGWTGPKIHFVDVGYGGNHGYHVIWGNTPPLHALEIQYLGTSKPLIKDETSVLFGGSDYVCGTLVNLNESIVKAGCPSEYGSYHVFRHEEPNYFANFIDLLFDPKKSWDMGGVTFTEYKYSSGTYLGKLGSGDSFVYHRPAGSLKLLQAQCIFGCDPGDKAEIWRGSWGKSNGPDYIEIDLEPGKSYYIQALSEKMEFSDSPFE